MEPRIARELKAAVDSLVELFNRPERKWQFTNENFSVLQTTPCSNDSAIVVLEKEKGKRTVCFFYYDGPKNYKRWKWFIPTDGMLAGMQALLGHKLDIETHNYPLNFAPHPGEVFKETKDA